MTMDPDDKQTETELDLEFGDANDPSTLTGPGGLGDVKEDDNGQAN
jgi:hypothetical protein